ncbi:hypothetical protein DSECCO2_573910 [anaerobic digester metagenome]
MSNHNKHSVNQLSNYTLITHILHQPPIRMKKQLFSIHIENPIGPRYTACHETSACNPAYRYHHPRPLYCRNPVDQQQDYRLGQRVPAGTDPRQHLPLLTFHQPGNPCARALGRHPYHYRGWQGPHPRFGLSHQELYPSKAHFQCKWLDRLPAQPSPADHCRRECRSHGGR